MKQWIIKLFGKKIMQKQQKVESKVEPFYYYRTNAGGIRQKYLR